MARRVAAMARIAKVQGIHPQPYFPVYRPWTSDQPPATAELSIQKTPMFYVPGIGVNWNGKLLSRSVERTLHRFCESGERLILDAHFGYPEGVGCGLAAKRLGLPFFVTLRGLEQPLFGTALGNQIVETLKEATGVIAVSESLRESAVAAGADPQSIEVIPNGIDQRVFSYRNVREKPVRPVVVSVGNIKRVKGHDVLIQAISKVIPTVDADFVIVGEDEEPRFADRVRRLAMELGVDKRIQFVGGCTGEEISHWLNRANLFVLASRREGCCNAILEALACGLPVVATDVGDNRRYVREGIGGILVQHSDSEALAGALIDALRSRFDYAAISRSVSSLSWEATAESVIRFMEQRSGLDVRTPQ